MTQCQLVAMEPIGTKRTLLMNRMYPNMEYMIAPHAIDHARPVQVKKTTSVQRVLDVPTSPLHSSQTPVPQMVLVHVDALSWVNIMMNSRTSALTVRPAVCRARTVTPVLSATRQRDTLGIVKMELMKRVISNVGVKSGKDSSGIRPQDLARLVTQVVYAALVLVMTCVPNVKRALKDCGSKMSMTSQEDVCATKDTIMQATVLVKRSQTCTRAQDHLMS